MLRDKLRGTGVALVTPFTPAGEVDFEALGKLIDFIIRDGVEYLVVLGTTGEASTLTRAEKIDIINFSYERVNSKVPVVIGIGGNNTKEVVEELETFPLDKAFAILSASPYYSKPSQEGIFQHYKALAATTPKPIILYNVPGRTGRNISAATTLRLAGEVDNIAGIKEASGDMIQCMQILKDKPADFMVVSGDDALALPQIACGMDGIISVVANCFPKLFSEMVRNCLKADFKTAKRLNDELMSIYDLLFSENNPAGVKAVLSVSGMISNHLRLPLVSLSDPLYNKIKGLLDAPGLQVKDF